MDKQQMDELFAEDLLAFSAELDRRMDFYTLRAAGDYWLIRRPNGTVAFWFSPDDEKHARDVLHNLNRAPGEPKKN